MARDEADNAVSLLILAGTAESAGDVWKSEQRRLDALVHSNLAMRDATLALADAFLHVARAEWRNRHRSEPTTTGVSPEALAQAEAVLRAQHGA